MRRETALALLFLATVAGFVGLEAHRWFGRDPEIHVAQEAPPLSAEEEAYQHVYESTAEGVVQITTRRYARTFFGVVPEEGMGSGFVVREDGIVLTNYHVVEGANWVEVGFTDGTRIEADWFRADPTVDLAVVKISPGSRTLKPLTLGVSEDLRIGRRVVAIGNPFGLSGTLTTGVVSALGRNIKAADGRVIEQVIQTDASINPGNSGGPLLDLAGHVIGMNTAIFSPSGGSVGIGFAVAIDRIKEALPRLLEGKANPSRGWLGIQMGDARGREGVFIEDVIPDSPAERAGLEEGQRIVGIDGEAVATREDVISRIGERPPGGRIAIQIQDDRGLSRTVEVELGRRLD